VAPLRVRFAPVIRLFTLLSALLLAGAGLLALPAQPATAATYFLPNKLTAYTDSAQARKAFPLDDLGEAPIGAWLDAEDDKHVSRGYYTFDLSRVTGRQITKATMSLVERAVTDCTRPRAIEVWRVASTSTAPTWRKAPAQVTRVGELAPSDATQCPSRYLYADVAPVLRTAQQEGAAAVTLMLRVPQGQEAGVAAGRRVSNVGISLEDNGTPDVPGTLSVNGVACAGGTAQIGTATPELRAVVQDADYPGNPFERLTGTFAYWPVDRPTERTEWTSSDVSVGTNLRYTIPTPLAQDVPYAFAVRATDRPGVSSAWSPECRFVVDTVRPGRPSISSSDYSDGEWAGGPGIPGSFTFKIAPGDTDVTQFRWGVSGVLENVPVGPDGTATVRFTPATDGVLTMSLTALDKALNRSETVSYTFRVRTTDPQVQDGNPDGEIFEPRTMVLSPGMADVVEYTYWLNDGAKTTVPAGADGKATIVVTPDLVGINYLHVTSRTSAGLPSGQRDYFIRVQTAPTLTSPNFPEDGSGEPPLVGEQVTFTFHPGMPGVTEYTWKVNRHEEQVVPAGPDGTATVTWKTRDTDYLSVEVTTRTADGLESEPNSYTFSLTSHAPAVDSTDYPMWTTAGGPGIPGTFTFTPARPGVTSYTWQLDDGQEQTLPAGTTGSATLTWTPTADQTGWHTLTVREHIGNIVSNPTAYEFSVAEAQPEEPADRRS
jgi:hypothetical protein